MKCIPFLLIFADSGHGNQCAAFRCYAREYKVVSGQKMKTGLRFIHFPKDPKEVAVWCNKIKRRNGKDGFKVSRRTVLCHKHFLPNQLKRAIGSARVNKEKGAVPVLFPWNNWSVEQPKRPSVIRKVPSPSSHPDLTADNLTTTALEERPIKMELNLLQGENTKLAEENKQLLTKHQEHEKENAKHREENKELREKLQSKFNYCPADLLVKKIKENNRDCSHYTAFTTCQHMKAIYDYCGPGENGENMLMPNSKSEKCKSGRRRALDPFIGYILTLMKLRQNFSFEYISFLFNISISTCCKTFMMWISYMYLRLGMISIWPSSQMVKHFMPQSMREKFPNTKVIIACSEIFIQCPSSLWH